MILRNQIQTKGKEIEVLSYSVLVALTKSCACINQKENTMNNSFKNQDIT